jgi:hypothetical protein
MTEIGCPAQERELEVFRKALEFNHQSPESGGTHIALAEEQHQMLLTFDMPADAISLDVVGEFLVWFGKQAVPWTNFVTSAHAASPVGIDALMNRA